MSALVKVANSSEIPEGKGKVVRVDGRGIAIFRVGDEFFAMDNLCLHRGGPLGEGELDGHKVICPWHGWTYDIKSGAFAIIPALKVRTYDTKLEEGAILIDMEHPRTPGLQP